MDETWGKFFYKPPGASYIAQGPQKQEEILKTYFLETIIIQQISFIFPYITIVSFLVGFVRLSDGAVRRWDLPCSDDGTTSELSLHRNSDSTTGGSTS